LPVTYNGVRIEIDNAAFGGPFPVAVDIVPGSCPNVLNPKSNGPLRVAVVGTQEFDPGAVDPASVRLLSVAPLGSRLRDVATPFEPFVGKDDAFDCTDSRTGWFSRPRVDF